MTVKYYLLYFIICITAASCTSEIDDSIEVERSGNFYSLEVELQNNEDLSILNSELLPDFPFSKTIKTNQYIVSVFNNLNEPLHSWEQDINDPLSFTMPGSGYLTASHDLEFNIPKPFYTLSGTEQIAETQTYVSVNMSNTEYALIAVYNVHVKSVSINGSDILPIIETPNGYEYIYTYVEPYRNYEIIITDIMGQSHTQTVSNLSPNEMYRISSDYISPFLSTTSIQNIVFISETTSFINK